MNNEENAEKLQLILRSINAQIGGILGYYTFTSSNTLVIKQTKKFELKSLYEFTFGQLLSAKINLSINKNKIIIIIFTNWYLPIFMICVMILIGIYTIPGSLRPGRIMGMLIFGILFILFSEIYARMKIKNSILKALYNIAEHDPKNYKLFFL